MSTKTKIFAYKGYVGIQSAPDAEGMIAKPEGGNFGVVVDADKAEISTEALELLKKVKRGRSSLGDIDVFQADDKMVILGWIGGYLNAFKPSDVEGSREYKPELLKATEGVEIPVEFKTYIDSL
jgi:hypothetical protein